MPEDKHSNDGHPYHRKHNGSCEYLFQVKTHDIPKYVWSQYSVSKLQHRMWQYIKDDCDPVSGVKMLDKAGYEPREEDYELRFRRVSKEEWKLAIAEKEVKKRFAELKHANNSRPVSVFMFCTDMFTQE